MNTGLLVVIGVIIADLILLLEIIFLFVRRGVSNKMISALFERKEEEFEKLSHSFSAKFLTKFEKEQIKFNVYSIQKEYSKIEQSIARFEESNLSKSNKKKIYPQIFYYYVERKKFEQAKDYYNRLQEIKVYKEKKEVEKTYDTYILGGYKYLDASLKELKHASKEQLPALETKIAKMYENKKINAEAKKYYRLAEKHQRELEEKRHR